MRAYDGGELSTTTKIRVTTAHCFDKLENTHSLQKFSSPRSQQNNICHGNHTEQSSGTF